ncbi:DapH/DapD/GlmU-related protein [Halomonas sp. THAF5a]|uniref:DapH/DapD/GlmU-related protein n=1 Tax=Halomonas sp. THAF5a TaxID=2587844 RepID=UPI001268EF16|nr:DapH/DapD/GlmU-related protein [Halomonas sp. THAF5a]
MIKKILILLGVYDKAIFINKVGVGKVVLNFIFQRVCRINAHVKSSVNYTSVFVGDNIEYVKDDLNILVSFASSNCLYVQSLNGIKFGRGILIAPGVKIISANHELHEGRRSVSTEKIEIGDNVWIGANAVILPGVKIGNGCVIGAGAVVTKSFLDNAVVLAGNPAKVIKKI